MELTFLFKVGKCSALYIISFIFRKRIFSSEVSLIVSGQTVLQLILAPDATVRSVAVALPAQELTGSNCSLQNSCLD
jgi:hypothetical protein